MFYFLTVDGAKAFVDRFACGGRDRAAGGGAPRYSGEWGE